MSEWVNRSLTDLAQYVNGYAFKPGDWSKEGLKIIRIEQLNNPSSQGDCYDGPIQEKHKVYDGDLLFSWSATLKALIWKGGNGVLNQHLFKVIPKEGIDKFLLCNLLDFYMDELAGGSHGSTMKHIKRSELESFTVDLPLEMTEQHKIAKILSTVDNLIEKTQALIDKYQSIKQGMMHDLFTRGVDENGHLRPSYEEAPHLYKGSELGWVPKEWEVEPLKQHTYSSAFGPRFPGEAYDVNGTVATMRTTDLDDEGKIDVESMPLAMLDLKQYREHLLQHNDLLITRSGTCGIASVFEGFRLPVLPGAFLIRFRLNPHTLLSNYLKLYINWCVGRNRVLINAEGGVQKNLKGSTLLKMLFPVPQIEDQEKIVTLVGSVEKKLESEQKYLKKLNLLRHGLMQDLLTGKVRVKVEA